MANCRTEYRVWANDVQAMAVPGVLQRIVYQQQIPD